jgi:hypothetical protein
LALGPTGSRAAAEVRAFAATDGAERPGVDPDRPQTASSPGLAPGSRLGIETVLGFSNTFRLAHWTPLVVTVTNRGGDVMGELEVEATSGDEFHGNLRTSFYRRELELPGNARKRFHFTVFLESFTHPLVVRVTSGGRELARHTLDLRHRFSTSRLLLVLSRDANLDYLNDSKGESLRVLYPHPELLPESWHGYDGVEALIVHGVSLELLSSRQYEALEKWLAQGGILAVSGGPDYSLLRTPRLAELLPAAPVGILRLPDGSAMSEALGEPLFAPRPFVIHRTTAERGRSRRQIGDAPLVIERERGRGKVLYLTFDVAGYPFDQWTGMQRLWLDLLRLPPVEPASYRPPEEVSVARTVIEKQGAGFPDHIIVVLFLGIYLGLLAVAFILLPEIQGSRAPPAWLPHAAPLLFAPLAFLIFGPLLFPKGAVAVLASVVEPFPNSAYAELKLDLGLYANRDHRFRFEYAGAAPVFRLLQGESGGDGASGWAYNGGSSTSLEAPAADAYHLRLLKGRDVIDFDLEASGEETEGGIHFRVRNSSGRPLDRVWAIYRSRAYSLGSISGDEALDRALSAEGSSLPLQDRAWTAFLRETAASDTPSRPRGVEEAVLDLAVGEARRAELGLGDRALLLGFSSNPLAAAGESAAWQRRDLTLVLCPLPVTPLPSTPMPGEWGYEGF